MKKIVFFIIISSFLYLPLYSQTVPCEELQKFIVKNGYREGTARLSLLSTWLRDVTAYSYEGKLYILAEIRDDDDIFGLNIRTYIFCHVPKENWERFQNVFQDLDKSDGQRFHKYIYDYKCNCK